MGFAVVHERAVFVRCARGVLEIASEGLRTGVLEEFAVGPLHAAFRLAPVQFNHALIGADARKRLVQRGLRNPGAAGIGAHPIQEAFKALAGNRLIGRRAIGRGGLMGGIRLWAAGRDQGRDSTK